MNKIRTKSEEYENKSEEDLINRARNKVKGKDTEYLRGRKMNEKNMTRKERKQTLAQKIRQHRDSGYTFVELIIIIAIMLILGSAIGLAVIRYIEQARIAMDVHNGSLIKDALNTYAFPSDFQGRDVVYTDPNSGVSESFKRGWVYVDKDEIRCSDQSTALAMIQAGLVHVSPETEKMIRRNEEDPNRWFPDGPDGDYIRRSGIDEYVFQNSIRVKARTTWNTYQLDVYIDSDCNLHLGASASNAIRTEGHAKDEEAASLFASKLGFYDAKITPIGEQYRP